jgi:hypothetical protein
MTEIIFMGLMDITKDIKQAKGLKQISYQIFGPPEPRTNQ